MLTQPNSSLSSLEYHGSVTPMTHDMAPNDSLANHTRKSGYEFYRTEQIAFLSVIFVVTVIGNVAVLLVIWNSKPGCKSRMNFFITNLVLADLAVAVFSMLVDLIKKITVTWYGGLGLCKTIRFLQTCATYGSTYILVAMSIDRLHAIARPMQFSDSGKRGRILVGVAWLCSALFSMPLVFILESTKVKGEECRIQLPQPWHWKLYFVLISLVLFVVPVIIITFCYVVIIYIIWKKSRSLIPSKSSTRSKISTSVDAEHNSTHQGMARLENTNGASSLGVIPPKIRTIKMTLVIVIVFLMCWSPYFVYNLLQLFGHNVGSRAFGIFIQSLTPLNSATNPLIYIAFSSHVADHLKKVSCCGALQRRVWYAWFSRRRDRGSFLARSTSGGLRSTSCSRLRSTLGGHRSMSGVIPLTTSLRQTSGLRSSLGWGRTGSSYSTVNTLDTQSRGSDGRRRSGPSVVREQLTPGESSILMNTLHKSASQVPPTVIDESGLLRADEVKVDDVQEDEDRKGDHKVNEGKFDATIVDEVKVAEVDEVRKDADGFKVGEIKGDDERDDDVGVDEVGEERSR